MKRFIFFTLVFWSINRLPSLWARGSQQDASGSLTLWVYDSGRVEVLARLGQQFEQQYGVPVNVSLVDLGEIRNQLLLGGAEAADMAIIPHDNLGALVENDAVLEIELGAKHSEFRPSSIEGFTYNGALYGFPLAAENIGFFINPAMVQNAPKTWDEVYQVGKALVENGQADYIMGFPDATYNVFPVYTSFGGYVFGKDNRGWDAADLGINQKGFVNGLSWLTKLVDQGLAPQVVDWDGAHVLFESGKAPFIATGPWSLNRFQSAGIKYKIVEFPSGAAPFLGVQGIVVSAASPNALLAQSFLVEFLAADGPMTEIFLAEQRPSAWKSVFEQYNEGDMAGFNAAGRNAVPMPSIPEMGYVWDAWVNAAALAFSGEMSPQEALDNAANQVKTQIAR